MLTNLIILAQDTTPAEGAGGPMGGLQSVLPFMLIMGFIFYFMLIRPQSKERKQREAMLASVKKNDRVVTIGGIIGTVQSVRDDEITLKVDESSNTKITFSRSAIQRVASRDSGSDKAEKEPSKS